MYTNNQLTHFNPNTLTNYLNSKSISSIQNGDFEVKTDYITINPQFITSSITGEILFEIPQNDTIIDYLEYLPHIYSSHKIECEENGWEPPPPNPNKPISADYEYADDDILQFSGFFGGKGILTYRNENITIHSCDMSKYEQFGAYNKTAEIVDAVTGKITDVFYGTWNDFNTTVIMEADKKRKFFLHVYDKGRKIDIQQVKLFAFNSEIVLLSNKLGEWRLLSWNEFAS